MNMPQDQQGYYQTDRSAYPTTPSTFPQSVYSPQVGQQGYAQNQQASYFPGAFSQQQQMYGQNAQYNAQQNQYMAMGQVQYGNDPTAGLTAQLSGQHLGTPRQGNAYPQQQRPRTGGGQNGQGQGTHLGVPGTASRPAVADGEGPIPNGGYKDPGIYSDNVVKRVTGLRIIIEAFFKDNITRARERNVRGTELDNVLNDPKISQAERDAASRKLWLKEVEHLRLLRRIEAPSNFSTIRIIGKGAFGEVKLVQRKADSHIYALKCLVKSEMFKKDQLAHVRAERDILAEADSPWVVKLHSTFQDKAFLYMLMEFLPGGDLMTMLIKYETFAPDIARFYMAEILLAIEAVHKLGFIHRDIKPDNILPDKSGHLKLTDFGLSTGFHKQHEASYYQQLLRGPSSSNSRRTNRQSVNLEQINLTVSNRGQINNWRKSRRVMAYSTVGTPDYIAPEIFSGQGYTFSCDWWSLGAIMYESVIGWPPFCADDPHETYRKIVNWQSTLFIPDDLPEKLDPATESLIRSLLCDSPNRIGHAGGPHGATEIKQHPYFHGVDWDALRTMNAPFKPVLKSNVDTEYFPIEDIPQEDHTQAWQREAEKYDDEAQAEMTLPFIGYTFKRFG